MYEHIYMYECLYLSIIYFIGMVDVSEEQIKREIHVSFSCRFSHCLDNPTESNVFCINQLRLPKQNVTVWVA